MKQTFLFVVKELMCFSVSWHICFVFIVHQFLPQEKFWFLIFKVFFKVCFCQLKFPAIDYTAINRPVICKAILIMILVNVLLILIANFF